MKNQLLPILLGLAALLLSMPAYALSCGDTVTTNTTLTADLICTSSSGLTVGASGVTINLNGFTISCHDIHGYLGSCQNSSTTSPHLNFNGIQSNGHNNVVVLGPGTITGFDVGVRLVNGNGLDVIGTTITGPAPIIDFPVTERLLTVGVLIQNTSCAIGSFALGWSAIVELNDISQQTQGVQLDLANCVLVTANQIHDNRGAFGDTHAIDLISSSFNVISTNFAARNGRNVGNDSAIQALNASNGGSSMGNQITFNYVIQNCGDGIALRNGASSNHVSANTALHNGDSVQGGLCVLPASPFYDLANRSEGPGDIWNPNNACITQSPGIPAGVCP